MKRDSVLMVVRPAMGGMLRHIETLSRGLVESGWRVGLCGPFSPDLAARFKQAGVQCWLVPIGDLPSVNDLKAGYRLVRIIKEGDFSCVHAHGMQAVWVARLALRHPGARRKPLVITLHMYPHGGSKFSRGIAGTLKQGFIICQHLLLSRPSDRYVAVSQAVAKGWQCRLRLACRSIRLIYNGVDQRLMDTEASGDWLTREQFGRLLGPNWPEDENVPTVGLVGRVIYEKGGDIAVRAISLLKSEGISVRLVIVGEGDFKQNLLHQAEQLGVSRLVHFTGYLQEAWKVMKHFDVLLVPSRFEPFGLVALEGMSLGIPVVASEVAGLSEIIAPGADNLEVAWRVPSENPHALAEAIKAILFDPFEREQRVKHARERVNGQFSPQLFVERYIGLYRSLISP